jgi:hypothetical protein
LSNHFQTSATTTQLVVVTTGRKYRPRKKVIPLAAIWYNDTHYHSAVGLQHPSDVHDGTAAAIRDDRQHVLDAAPRRPSRPVHPTTDRTPTATTRLDQQARRA